MYSENGGCTVALKMQCIEKGAAKAGPAAEFPSPSIELETITSLSIPPPFVTVVIAQPGCPSPC